MTDHLLTRRQIAGRWLAATSLGLAAALPGGAGPAGAQTLPETPRVRRRQCDYNRAD